MSFRRKQKRVVLLDTTISFGDAICGHICQVQLVQDMYCRHDHFLKTLRMLELVHSIIVHDCDMGEPLYVFEADVERTLGSDIKDYIFAAAQGTSDLSSVCLHGQPAYGNGLVNADDLP